MQEMLEYIVKSLVSNPDAVEVTSSQDNKAINFKVKVDAKDLGSVIGRNGTIANSIRTVVKSLNNAKVRVGIKFDAK